MPKIALDPFVAPHQPSLGIGYRLPARRFLTHISLESRQGWSRFHRAVVDTGAPISMFPKHVWRNAQFTLIGRLSAGGVVQREECRIPATLEEVSCPLTDGKESIGPLKIHDYLAESDDAPTLLGVNGVPEENTMWVDIRGQSAFIESA